MRIVAADLSLTATGVAYLYDDLRAGVIQTKAIQTLSRRVTLIAEGILDAIGRTGADLLVLEDVPFGPYGVPIAMMHGAVRAVLERAEINFPVVTIPPATLKKYATGKGNARKPDMLDAARSRLGWTGSNDDNVIDALWLLAAGMDWYGEPLCAMPKANRDALAKVEWADLNPEEAA